MSATKFRLTEQAIEKLTGSDKRTRYYDAQMPGLIIDVLPSKKKTFWGIQEAFWHTEATFGHYRNFSIHFRRTG